MENNKENIFDANFASIKQEANVEFLLILPQKSENFVFRQIKEELNDSDEEVESENLAQESSNSPEPVISFDKAVDKKFHCDVCSYSGKAKHLLKLHKESHKLRYKCETCERRFSVPKTYKTHQIRYNHGIYAANPAKKHACDVCNKLFDTGEYLQKHKKLTHSKLKFYCDHCPRICKNKVEMVAHVFGHFKVPCRVCNKLYNKHIIKHHVRSHFIRFQCDFCGFMTNDKGTLQTHIKRVHAAGKVLCQLKGCKTRKFSNNSELDKHKKIHLHDLHWKCPSCQFRTQTKPSLMGHIKHHEKKKEPMDNFKFI
jgi:KRAB domain-containing zinc finger protein